MDYRVLSEADLKRWQALEDYAFLNTASPVTPEQRPRLRGLWVAGEQVAQLEILPLTLETGHAQIAACGFASVATAPEARRLGYAEELLRHACAEMRERGMGLNILYPFKRSFYGRFGWATFMERRVYQAPPASFRSFRALPGGFRAASYAQIADFATIYRGALRGRFGPTVRDESWWRRVLTARDGRPHHGFIWYDPHGQPRSFLIYQIIVEGANRRLECQDIVALDPQARSQLFRFFANHQDHVGMVRFKAPADAPVNLLMPDPLECTVEPHFMLRILDVPTALNGYGFPRDLSGHVRIGVHDDWISSNQGVFELEIAHGHAHARRMPDDTPADISCDVRVLAQIYSRYMRPRTAAAFGVLNVSNRTGLAFAERAFAGLAPFNADYF
ncbi:GNAT family N-acetyltransferase [Candidatus Oscillochloris fontis]|uniref:GNAT family N-acetyltransferase n=1 Tax=Candidatus Oscillochloris fontis TaxID=2496868 RepID=UPI00101B96E4|nr:GNAT family N-acetyltransferase [Candidatus Oscillochloris fontis]